MEIAELKALRSEVLMYQSVFDRVDALRDQLERITAQYGAEPHGGSSGDKMSDMVSQIVDILNSLCKQLIEIEKKRYAAEQEIAQLIGGLPDLGLHQDIRAPRACAHDGRNHRIDTRTVCLAEDGANGRGNLLMLQNTRTECIVNIVIDISNTVGKLDDHALQC